MNSIISFRLLMRTSFILLLCIMGACTQPGSPDPGKSTVQDEPSNQLPGQYMPVMGVWGWNKSTLQPDGYKKQIDQASLHSPYNMLIPFLRFPDKEITDEEIYNQVKLAAEYALQRNIDLVPDLDIRSARRAFRNQYPEDLQDMLRIQDIALSENDFTESIITSIADLDDHYCFGAIPDYDSEKSDLLRVYAYHLTSEGIDPETLKDITNDCTVTYSSADSVIIRIPPAEDDHTHASALVAFTLFYPDIFSPHLMEFQRKLIEKYADIPLAGVCKDEWGFPPYYPRFYNPSTFDFWYSDHIAREYEAKTGGRELLADCLLMYKGIKGKKNEQQMAINHFREMTLQRNVALEDDFYHTVKEVFGPSAAVTVHATWWPYPDLNEYKKNGLDWWGAKRDWAQTDELAPFAARTALCKKWGSPIWYNMYYSRNFESQVWSSALAGGRINYLSYRRLYNRDLMRAESRVRLLNAISQSPLDCPVAVVFGHSCAMNWAGPHYNDVGMKLADTLWYSGYPADLIPTSEIENGSLQVDKKGWVRYGDQRYAAVILYHPEFEKESTSEFFLKAGKGKTALFRVGDWTRDFHGTPVDGDALLPDQMLAMNSYQDAYLSTLEKMKKQNIQRQTPSTELLDSSYWSLEGFSHTSYCPPTTGFSRLIDGTVIHIAGTRHTSGDTIQTAFEIHEHPVRVDAVGVAAVRLDKNGKLEALAAGGLKSFKAGSFEINLDERLDIALWVDHKGKWQGIVQGCKGAIPADLLNVTEKWTRLHIPEPPPDSNIL
jgi:hypothetical protein